jgi:hypothetical protein
MTVGASIDLLKDNSVVIDYTSLDRESIAEDLRTFAQTQFHDRWTNFNETEFAVVFLEIIAYIGDLITYQFNAVIGETQPSTVVRRQNFINIAKSYDFFLSGPVGSTVELTATSDVAQLPYTLFADSAKFRAANGTVFMPVVDTVISIASQVFDAEAGDLIDNLLLSLSDGSQNQNYILEETGRQTPLLYRNFPSAGNQPILTVTVGGAIWELKKLEADAQSTDEVYFLRTDEDDISTIFFGDGINGKIPAVGAEIRYTAKIGTDQTSNVNPRTITSILTPVPGLTSITNVKKAGGGSPRQTLQQGKTALPASISTNNRSVVREDYAALLISDDAPTGVAKASATKGVAREVNIWVVPEGGGALTLTLANEVSAFMIDKKILGQKIIIRDRTDIPILMALDVYVSSNWRPDDVISRVRELFVTEDPDVLANTGGNGVYDFPNVGLAALDDAGQPQITETRIQKLSSTLEDLGVQKIVVSELRTVPVGKPSVFRVNNGNGTLKDVIYLDDRNVVRREFVVRFTSSVNFSVFRRVVGNSTFLNDTQLVDNRLDISNQPDFSVVPSLDMTLNPNRFQTVSFTVDTNPLVTFGSTVTVVGNTGSVFGNADVGSEYYLEIPDGSGILAASTLSTTVYSSPVGDVQFSIEAGSLPFAAGDELSIDVFPTAGDVLLRFDELPIFRRDPSGQAIDFTTNAKTAI